MKKLHGITLYNIERGERGTAFVVCSGCIEKLRKLPGYLVEVQGSCSRCGCTPKRKGKR